MATTYHDTDFLAWALQARTDESSSPGAEDDATGEDARILLDFYTEGVVSGLAVTERGAGANMSVDVEVGLAVIEGANTDQGKYAAKIAGVNDINVTLDAADPSNPRIDEIYLVVLDDGYDSSGFVRPRLAVRDGTPASSPSAPGPDGAWDAYLLLASVAVAANEDAIEDEHITDERVNASVVVASANAGAFVEFGGATNTTQDSTVTSTYENGASVSFTMPADWNTYKIMAWGSALFAGSTGGTPVAKARVSIGGNTGTERGVSIGADNPSRIAPIEVRHERTGLSANATVVVQYGETSSDVTHLSSVVNFIAVRTS